MVRYFESDPSILITSNWKPIKQEKLLLNRISDAIYHERFCLLGTGHILLTYIRWGYFPENWKELDKV